jgi:major intrinsic protein
MRSGSGVPGNALRAHWPEYLAEAAGLGLFMVSACVFGTLLGHPDSAIVRALPDPVGRRVLMGAIYISVEAPISGMSMNPARSLASAMAAQAWAPLWIYWAAPPLGMLLAAQVYVTRHGLAQVFCAKLHHDNAKRCIFRCRYAELAAGHPESMAPEAARAAFRPRA